ACRRDNHGLEKEARHEELGDRAARCRCRGQYMTNHPRRAFLRLAAGAAALPALSRIASAQTYPSRPITMIVAASAGGATDIVARIIAEPMRASLGQPVIVENVTGAGGVIGTGRAGRASPDGHTLTVGNFNTHVANGAVYALQYDIVKDFE